MLDYAPHLQEPGYNVIASMPGKVIRNLPFKYDELGHERLELLNKTDRRWLVESWGEPHRHATLNELHQSVWNHYEYKLIHERSTDRVNIMSGLGSESRKRPWWKWW